MKYIYYFLIWIVLFNIGVYLFNHVNPWAGIIEIVSLILLTIKLLTKQKNETV